MELRSKNEEKNNSNHDHQHLPGGKKLIKFDKIFKYVKKHNCYFHKKNVIQEKETMLLLVNVIGKIWHVFPLERIKNNKYKKIVKVIDDTHCILDIILWDKQAQSFHGTEGDILLIRKGKLKVMDTLSKEKNNVVSIQIHFNTDLILNPKAERLQKYIEILKNIKICNHEKENDKNDYNEENKNDNNNTKVITNCILSFVSKTYVWGKCSLLMGKKNNNNSYIFPIKIQKNNDNNDVIDGKKCITGLITDGVGNKLFDGYTAHELESLRNSNNQENMEAWNKHKKYIDIISNAINNIKTYTLYIQKIKNKFIIQDIQKEEN